MKLLLEFCAVLVCLDAADAQMRLQSIVPDEAERAFLAAPAKLNQLDCGLERQKPKMGIDLRFHTGFIATVPLKRLAGEAGELRTLVRVTPLSVPERPVFFSMVTPTPALDRRASGDAELRGEFAVGPGRYVVDWLLSFGESSCRAEWKIEAKLADPFSRVPLAIGAGAAAELPPDPFEERGELPPRAAHSLYVKLLVNFSPAGRDQTIMDSEDVRVITAILRAVSREPRFGRFRVVAFSSEQERVLQRQPIGSKVDFRALGRAVGQLRSGVVSIRQMQDPRSTTRFLETLLAEELRPAEEQPDAVMLISPKLSLEEKISERELAELAPVPCPVFLLSYNPQPVADPWEGALARAVKKAYRGLEYTISGASDLGKALDRIKSELPRSR